MIKSDKELNAFVKGVINLYGENLEIVATTFERSFNDRFGAKLNIVLKEIKGGEFLKLREMLQESQIEIGLFASLDELLGISRSLLVPLFTDCRVLYGSKSNLPKISRADIKNCIVDILSDTLLTLREIVLVSELEYAAQSIQSLYISAAYAVSYLYYLRENKFVAQFSQLKNLVNDKEYNVLDIAQNWQRLKSDRKNSPEDGIIFLENFCSDVLKSL